MTEPRLLMIEVLHTEDICGRIIQKWVLVSRVGLVNVLRMSDKRAVVSRRVVNMYFAYVHIITIYAVY